MAKHEVEGGVDRDQDVGNYEFFLNQDLITNNYITTGRVYQIKKSARK